MEMERERERERERMEVEELKPETKRERGRQTGLTKRDTGTREWVMHWPIRGFDT